MTSNTSPTRKYRLLIAEDDRALRTLIVAVFEASGYHVVAVENGLDLLDTLEVSLVPELGAEKFDLVIADVRMPEMSGLGVFEHLRSRPGVPPVVFITAFADEEAQVAAAQVGALAVLEKPVDLAELETLVRGFLVGRDN
jgi:two-component system, NtrC family, response regulator AtoC